MRVSPVPPSESDSSLVRLLSRYGMCLFLPLESARAAMHLPVWGVRENSYPQTHTHTHSLKKKKKIKCSRTFFPFKYQ